MRNILGGLVIGMGLTMVLADCLLILMERSPTYVGLILGAVCLVMGFAFNIAMKKQIARRAEEKKHFGDDERRFE